MCPLTFVRGSGSRRATPLADRIVIIQSSRLFYGLQENWDKIRVAYWTEHQRFTIFSPAGATVLGETPDIVLYIAGILRTCRNFDGPARQRASGQAAGKNTGVSMRFFKSYIQHRFNPLHVYCRLRDYGLSSRVAIRITSAYERVYRVCSFRTTPDC